MDLVEIDDVRFQSPETVFAFFAFFVPAATKFGGNEWSLGESGERVADNGFGDA